VAPAPSWLRRFYGCALCHHLTWRNRCAPPSASLGLRPKILRKYTCNYKPNVSRIIQAIKAAAHAASRHVAYARPLSERLCPPSSVFGGRPSVAGIKYNLLTKNHSLIINKRKKVITNVKRL